MKPRLIILIVAAAGLAVAFALRSASPPDAGGKDGSGDPPSEGPPEGQMVWTFELPGEEPEEEAEFDVNVRVDTSTGKNRLVLEITEVHGYYAEYIVADIWYVGDGETGEAGSRPIVTHRMNRYIKANETLVECLELVPRELLLVGGSIGSSEDWEAEITSCYRSRSANPESFPPAGGENRCGG